VAATSAVPVVSTPVVPPEQWFPLIRAAWTYVHTFARDILRAQQRYQNLLAQATAMTPDLWTDGSPIPPIPSPSTPTHTLTLG
jgi:hypothetical protein